MTNAFIEKIKLTLQTLPFDTEISMSITDKTETSFIGLRKDAAGIKFIDSRL